MIKHLMLLKIQNMMDIKEVLLPWFDKKTSGSGIKNENISRKEIAEELHKAIIRKFKKQKVYSAFIDNIWGADMQLICKLTAESDFYYVLLIFLENTHGFYLQKIKKELQLLMLFKKF